MTYLQFMRSGVEFFVSSSYRAIEQGVVMETDENKVILFLKFFL